MVFAGYIEEEVELAGVVRRQINGFERRHIRQENPSPVCEHYIFSFQITVTEPRLCIGKALLCVDGMGTYFMVR